MIQCDGDCGGYYYYKEMNLTCYGQKLCDNCMFTFVAEQERKEYEKYMGRQDREAYKR